MFGCDVMDSDGHKIGTVDNVWVDDATSALEFVGVKMGFLMGKTHIIPTADAQIDNGTITVPYNHDLIKDAPSYGGDDELSNEQEQQVYSYYGMQRSDAASPTGLAGGTMDTSQTDTGGGQYDTNRTDRDLDTTRTDRDLDTTRSDRGTTGFAGQDDQAGVVLSEEELQVGKREVESGRVRLRKVVRTEHQEVPVDLRREEVSVERVSADNAEVPGDAFNEQEIEVPVNREEAVVGKESRVTGQVRLNKDVTTETQNVGGDVRREDVETEGLDDNLGNRTSRSTTDTTRTDDNMGNRTTDTTRTDDTRR